MRRESRGLEHLSPRDKRILALIVQGKTTKEISETLEVAVGTLRSRRKELMRKMGVKNTVALITSALGRGFED